MQAKKHNNGTRTKQIHIRASQAEFEQLREQAQKAGLRLSDYLRHAGVTAQIIQPIPEIVTRSIGGFGRNLNQCAKACNEAGKVEVQTLENLRAEVKHLVALLQGRRN